MACHQSQPIGLILPPQPHLMSGYTGHIPGYAAKFGGSFGNLTHEVLRNRQSGSKSFLTDLNFNQEEVEAINNRCKCPSYTGHIPQYQFIHGHR